MKKVLFATTALVASAGFAAADVDLKGSAEFGVFGGDGIDLQFHTDIDVTFALSGETDGGLSFGASIDLDESIGDVDAAGQTVFGQDPVGESDATRDDSQHGGASFFIKGDFGNLNAGDTDGALDWAMQEVLVAGGSLGDNEEHGGYNGNSGLDGDLDGQIVRYDYSFDAFSIAASVEVDDTGVADPIWGLGVKYDLELGGFTLGLGAGFQDSDAGDAYGISIDGEFDSGLLFALNFSEVLNVEHFGIGLGYEMDQWAFGLNYGDFDGGNSGIGLAVEYDLGGGAALQFGYGNTDLAAGGNADSYSFGLAMSF